MGNLLQRHLERPVREYVKALQEKAHRVVDLLDGPAALDQYPGRRIPFNFTRIFTVDGPVTANRDAGELAPAPQRLAPLADPSAYILPREGPIRVGRFGTWHWTRASHTVYASLTYAPGDSVPFTQQPRTFSAFGDLFDAVQGSNGGAVWMGNRAFSPVATSPSTLIPNTQPNFSFRLGMYDRLRGAYMHDGVNLPVHFTSGQLFDNRALGTASHFDANTEIEVRLFVDEIKWANILDTDVALERARSRVYFVLTLMGYLDQDDTAPSDRARPEESFQTFVPPTTKLPGNPVRSVPGPLVSRDQALRDLLNKGRK